MAVSYGVGRRCGSDLALLWLWRRLAGIPLIRPLAWEPPYAMSMALKSKIIIIIIYRISKSVKAESRLVVVLGHRGGEKNK